MPEKEKQSWFRFWDNVSTNYIWANFFVCYSNVFTNFELRRELNPQPSKLQRYKSKYKKVGLLPICIVKSNVLMVWTLLSISAVHQPFYISISISTLPTQHTTFICLRWDALTIELRGLRRQREGHDVSVRVTYVLLSQRDSIYLLSIF